MIDPQKFNKQQTLNPVSCASQNKRTPLPNPSSTKSDSPAKAHPPQTKKEKTFCTKDAYEDKFNTDKPIQIQTQLQLQLPKAPGKPINSELTISPIAKRRRDYFRSNLCP